MELVTVELIVNEFPVITVDGPAALLVNEGIGVGEDVGVVEILETVTVEDELETAPLDDVALTMKVCEPFVNKVVSNTPSGSPLNWYGAVFSVHLRTPSIRKSTLEISKPVVSAFHITFPVNVLPSIILDLTAIGIVVGVAAALGVREDVG